MSVITIYKNWTVRNKLGSGPRAKEGKDEKQKCLTGRDSTSERS